MRFSVYQGDERVGKLIAINPQVFAREQPTVALKSL